MIGKFVVFAVLCVSLAQLQEGGLEEAIQNGLERAKVLYEVGKKNINGNITEVNNNVKFIETSTVEFVRKSEIVRNQTRDALIEEAKATEEKAKELNKPLTVIQCIRRAEKDANTRILYLTNKFKTDMNRLKEVKLANIKTNSKPLYEMEAALGVRNKTAVRLIKNCRNPACVDTAVNSYNTWMNTLYDNIHRILGQVTTVVANFKKDATIYSSNTNTQITQIKNKADRDMTECLNMKRA